MSTAIGSPPRVWGRRSPPAPPPSRATSVHPHVCGEGANTYRERLAHVRFTPTCVGKAPGRGVREPKPFGSPPRVWGRRDSTRYATPPGTVHPHVCGEGTCLCSNCHRLVGSPPRVWGRRHEITPPPGPARFTPTCVGKALSCNSISTRTSVHPHVCGEGDGLAGAVAGNPGSPPRVWGRRLLEDRGVGVRRFTPTCLGKAVPVGENRSETTVHPHVCGEGSLTYVCEFCSPGSPPRVWGRHQVHEQPGAGLRFTPTCVGKASARGAGGRGCSVHPHVCGEGSSTFLGDVTPVGSPPRVWGRHQHRPVPPGTPRFTPTCVGKAPANTGLPASAAVHPHVCGEGWMGLPALAQNSGSPPRVWGRRGPRSTWRATPGFTPTCVGKAPPPRPGLPDRPGSPPRVWGRLGAGPVSVSQRRFTPTCVGKASAAGQASGGIGGSPPRVWGRLRPARRTTTARAVHPHVCGEGDSRALMMAARAGSPPRVWGRPGGRFYSVASSTVHPHVCGEGARPPVGARLPSGSPPRVWGRRRPLSLVPLIARFTPTCVGKAHALERLVGGLRFTPTCVGKAPRANAAATTLFCSPPRVWGRRPGDGLAGHVESVHPHVCGEGMGTVTIDGTPGGSPPRVWGRRTTALSGTAHVRFTPTCVGKACVPRACFVPRRAVHPHVCGEGTLSGVTALCSPGSPPRVWGRRLRVGGQGGGPRFTPTCVGKAWWATSSRRATAVHPHVCGEGLMFLTLWRADNGSPPRVWGRRTGRRSQGARSRFTPTCVGKAGGPP